MRLITFVHGDTVQIGAWFDQDRRIVALQRAQQCLAGVDLPAFASMQALIEAGPAALERAYHLLEQAPVEAVLETAAVRLLAPVPTPIQMRDCVAFEQHIRQAKRASAMMRLRNHPDAAGELAKLEASGALAVPQVWYDRPIYYKQNRFSVIGTGTDVEWPPYANVLDYELEFGVFLGKTGKNIPVDQARDHIFGYTVFNDVSARDTQAAESLGMMGPAKGKDFDTGNVLGPCIVTADELTDPYALRMTAKVNGELWSEGNSATMHHRFEDIIAYISQSETLYAGEFLGSGTVGNGCGFELQRFPQPGDVVEICVEGIGTLRNRYVRT